jgi:regulator of RNase E activity RraA
VNVAIQCAGVTASPGDIIVVDGNGVVVVPTDEAAVILKTAQRLLDTGVSVLNFATLARARSAGCSGR